MRLLPGHRLRAFPDQPRGFPGRFSRLTPIVVFRAVVADCLQVQNLKNMNNFASVFTDPVLTIALALSVAIVLRLSIEIVTQSFQMRRARIKREKLRRSHWGYE